MSDYFIEMKASEVLALADPLYDNYLDFVETCLAGAVEEYMNDTKIRDGKVWGIFDKYRRPTVAEAKLGIFNASPYFHSQLGTYADDAYKHAKNKYAEVIAIRESAMELQPDDLILVSGLTHRKLHRQ
jgi:hypothetical protein